jgi:hypothetical protein
MKRRVFVMAGLASCVSRGRIEEDVRPRARVDASPPVAKVERPASAPTDPAGVRARALEERFGPEGFHVVVEPPFVVIGDEPEADVKRRAQGTVRWAVERLRAEYFSRDPDALIEVWLFGTDASYEKWATELFGGPPDTPYGYYTHEHEALVMNISTGGGTLVHEIVHPFMASNFPKCPSWFDEGLASLYEQSMEHEGRIWGLPNWRLPDLQRAIRAGELPSSKALFATGDRPFYDDDPGTNYAHARYVCLWLQENGTLKDFYHAFVAAADEDPTGHATFAKLLGVTQTAKWDRAWQKWVLGLQFG